MPFSNRRSSSLQIPKERRILFFSGKSKIEKAVKGTVAVLVLILGIAVKEPIRFMVAQGDHVFFDKEFSLGVVLLVAVLFFYGLFTFGKATEIASGPLIIGN